MATKNTESVSSKKENGESVKKHRGAECKAIPIEEFKKIVAEKGGNLTAVANAIGVSRFAIYDWAKKVNPDYYNIIVDSRKKVYDECLQMARVVALGIPEKDNNGRIIGWIQPPNPSMLQFFLDRYGRDEGMGHTLDITTGGQSIGDSMFRRVTPEEIDKFKDDFDKQY